jgi:hypothetical protein
MYCVSITNNLDNAYTVIEHTMIWKKVDMNVLLRADTIFLMEFVSPYVHIYNILYLVVTDWMGSLNIKNLVTAIC